MKISILFALVLLFAGCGGGTPYPKFSTTYGSGKVIVNSVPENASITIDGNFVGMTNDYPIEVSAKEKHLLEVKKEGYGDFQTIFSLEANEEKKIEIVLESL